MFLLPCAKGMARGLSVLLSVLVAFVVQKDICQLYVAVFTVLTTVLLRIVFSDSLWQFVALSVAVDIIHRGLYCSAEPLTRADQFCLLGTFGQCTLAAVSWVFVARVNL